MATKNTPATTATTTVTALVPVQYDLKPVAVGETFDVRAEDLPQLLEVAAVEVLAAAAAA
jgi:hypothetical protein